MFTDRPPEVSILFLGHHTTGQKIKNSVVAGDDIGLMCGEEVVLVRNVEVIGPTRYRGLVAGFKSFESPHPGLSLGQSVEFNEGKIFDCSTP